MAQPQSNPEQCNSDLTSVDRAILDTLRLGGCTGRELAHAVEVPGRSIGSRLTALVKRGLITGSYYAGMNTWFLTDAGSEEARRS